VGSVVIVEVDEPGVAVVAFDFCVPVLDVCPNRRPYTETRRTDP
jgi:hypothetical protein